MADTPNLWDSASLWDKAKMTFAMERDWVNENVFGEKSSNAPEALAETAADISGLTVEQTAQLEKKFDESYQKRGGASSYADDLTRKLIKGPWDTFTSWIAKLGWVLGGIVVLVALVALAYVWRAFVPPQRRTA